MPKVKEREPLIEKLEDHLKEIEIHLNNLISTVNSSQQLVSEH
jgi:hypothetical protein